MKVPVSEVVGFAEDNRGKEVPVYRALRHLLCAECGSGIKEGDLFTRRKLAGIKFYPSCRECLPFELLNETNSRSPLIEFLLKPEPTASKDTKTSGQSNRELISKEVEKRLGAVLARCRKRGR
jgi:hypothetical protein